MRAGLTIHWAEPTFQGEGQHLGVELTSWGGANSPKRETDILHLWESSASTSWPHPVLSPQVLGGWAHRRHKPLPSWGFRVKMGP